MPFVQWNKNDYGVEIGEIDKQHQKLFDLTNKFYQSTVKGEGRKALGEVFTGLVEYVKIHFESEEKLMKEISYPDIDEHMKQHRFLSFKIRGYYQKTMEELRNGSNRVNMEILKFMKEWVVAHIGREDRKIGVYYQYKYLKEKEGGKKKPEDEKEVNGQNSADSGNTEISEKAGKIPPDGAQEN